MSDLLQRQPTNLPPRRVDVTENINRLCSGERVNDLIELAQCNPGGSRVAGPLSATARRRVAIPASHSILD